MRILPVLMIAGASVISMPGYAQQNVSYTEASLTLGTVGVRFNDAWYKGDSKLLGSFFTEDAIFVTPAGIEVGREAIQKNLALHAGKSMHSGTIDQVRPLTADSFWAAGSWKNVDNNGGPTYIGYWTEYYVREGDDWKIRMATVSYKKD
jgi:ketosteroid isomerase-like protein